MEGEGWVGSMEEERRPAVTINVDYEWLESRHQSCVLMCI